MFVIDIVVSTALAASPAHAADIWSFCTGPRPDATNQWSRDLYDSQCPAFIQSQFTSTAVSLQGAQATTLQNQTQALTSIEGLLKAPPQQVSSVADISGLAFTAQVKDAETTFRLARYIGLNVSKLLSGQPQGTGILLVTGSTDVAALVASPVDPQLILDQLSAYQASLKQMSCATGGQQANFVPLAIGLAAVTIVSTLANAVQPSLLTASKTAGVQDPSQIIIAGVSNGITPLKLYVATPTVSSGNKVSSAVKALQDAVAKGDAITKQCADNPSVKAGSGDLTASKAYLTAIGTVGASGASVLDVATRKQQLVDNGVRYLLFAQRDVSGGGAAAIKPSWFRSTQIVVGAADEITYRLVQYPDGTIMHANMALGTWTNTCGLGNWSGSACMDSAAIRYFVDGEEVKSESGSGVLGQ